MANLLKPPEWIVGLLAGSLSFSIVVAIALFFVNFPSWRSHKINKQRSANKRRLECYGGKESGGKGLLNSSGCNKSLATADYTDNDASRPRKRKNLSINTSARYKGLGIVVPRIEEENPPRPLHQEVDQPTKSRSLDNQSLQDCHRDGPNATKTTWQALTTPLPSARAFLNRTNTPKLLDLESGAHERSQSEGVSVDDLGSSRFLVHASSKSTGDINLLTRVGDGVEYAASRLSKAMARQLDVEAEGLPLPVINTEEREIGASYKTA